MATKERLAAMAASLCAVCSGAMVVKLVEADPSDSAVELRTYVCAGCGHSQTYGVEAETADGGMLPDRALAIGGDVSVSMSVRQTKEIRVVPS